MNNEKANPSYFSTMTKGVNYLLLIAIDKYDSRHFPPLWNCVKDAQDIRQILVEQYDFEKENVITLFDKEATRNRIINTFGDLYSKLRKQDNLIFLFSGHGVFEQDSGHWIPVDAKKKDYSSYIRNGQITGRFKGMKARHIVGMVDSCFAGSLFKGIRGAISPEPNLMKSRSRYLMTAGRMEVVSSGPKGKNSPFAASIIDILESNKDKLLWAPTIGIHVVNNVPFNANQTPHANTLGKPNGHDGGAFPFPRRDTPIKVTFNDIKVYPSYFKMFLIDITSKLLKLQRTGFSLLIGLSIFLGAYNVRSQLKAIFFDDPLLFVAPQRPLMVVPDTINFGDVEKGREKKDTCVIRNDGDTTLVISNIKPSSGWLKVIDTQHVIKAGDSVFLELEVDASNLEVKKYSDSLKVFYNDTLKIVYYSLNIFEKHIPPEIKINKVTRDLDTIYDYDTSSTTLFKVTNSGGEELKIIGITSNSNWLKVLPFDNRLMPNEIIAVTLSIQPKGFKKNNEARIKIKSNASNIVSAISYKVNIINFIEKKICTKGLNRVKVSYVDKNGKTHESYSKQGNLYIKIPEQKVINNDDLTMKFSLGDRTEDENQRLYLEECIKIPISL